MLSERGGSQLVRQSSSSVLWMSQMAGRSRLCQHWRPPLLYWPASHDHQLPGSDGEGGLVSNLGGGVPVSMISWLLAKAGQSSISSLQPLTPSPLVGGRWPCGEWGALSPSFSSRLSAHQQHSQASTHQQLEKIVTSNHLSPLNFYIFLLFSYDSLLICSFLVNTKQQIDKIV